MSWARAPHTAFLALLACLAAGCIHGENELKYLGEKQLQYYRDAAQQIDFAHTNQELSDEVKFSGEPRTIATRRKDPPRDISLREVLHIALANNPIIRSSAFRQDGNPLFSNPDRIASVYDPAIQETGFLFGGRGLESALAAFDAQLDASMVWGRNDLPSNSNANPGFSNTSETGRFRSSLSKQFAYGGSLALSHDWDYLGTNSPGVLFPSSYAGDLSAEYRLPLLAGAGTEFTSIAGPIAASFRGITGVNQGVVIARINNDITVAQFEENVRNLLRDVENLYWDLYLAYRLFDAAATSRNSARLTWKNLKEKERVGGVEGFELSQESEARDQFFLRQSLAEQAFGAIRTTETRLRDLIGLPVNDGYILRPSDEPSLAKIEPDWRSCLTEALARRVELRRQKWNIKSLEFQLQASKSLTRPRLDFVGGYRFNAFGDQLFGDSDADGITAEGWRSAYETLSQGDHTGWDLGFEMTMPIGFRNAHAQVKNYELRLAKARKVLETQELTVSHELAAAFQDLEVNYAQAQSNFNRRRAAQKTVQLFTPQVEVGTKTVDELLRAQARLLEAESDYYRFLVAYNKAITDLHLRKGTLLEYNGVQLAEGDWDPEAYDQALRKAWARTHAFDAKHVETIPAPFAHGVPEDVWLPDAPSDERDAEETLTPVPETEGLPPVPGTAPEGIEGGEPDTYEPPQPVPPNGVTEPDEAAVEPEPAFLPIPDGPGPQIP